MSALHENSAPGNGFWSKNYLVGVNGHSTENNAIEAVKDNILWNPSLLEIPTDKEMLRSVKNARQCYEIDLDEKQMQNNEEGSVKKVVEGKEDDWRHSELENIAIPCFK